MSQYSISATIIGNASITGNAVITGYANIPRIMGTTIFDTTPTAPTPAASDNSTTIATTAYVKSQGYATTNSTNPSWSGTGTFGTGITSGSATIIGNITCGNATISGTAILPTINGATNFTTTPTAPTPAVSNNSTTIATTAYVKSQGYSTTDSTYPYWGGNGTFGGSVSAFSASITNGLTAGSASITNGLTAGSASITNGLTAGSASISGSLTAGSATISTINGATNFTTTPTAPTPAVSDNSTIIATTAYVKSQGYSTVSSASPTFTGKVTVSNGIAVHGAYEQSSAGTLAYIRGVNSNMNDPGGQGQSWYAGLKGFSGAPDSVNVTAYWSIYAPSSSILAGGIAFTSDIRLKTNIKDIEGNEGLVILRKLAPKIYNFIDHKKNNNKPKMGFIAQEIESIFPCCVNTVTDFLPDIFEKCQVINGNTIILENKSTTLFKGDTPIKIKYYDSSDNSFTTTISSIIDNKSFIVTDKISEEFIFVYGQEVSDVKNIDYDSVFSFVTAAVKTIDEIVQEQQTQMEILQKKNDSLERRLALLEEKMSI